MNKMPLIIENVKQKFLDNISRPFIEIFKEAYFNNCIIFFDANRSQKNTIQANHPNTFSHKGWIPKLEDKSNWSHYFFDEIKIFIYSDYESIIDKDDMDKSVEEVEMDDITFLKVINTRYLLARNINILQNPVNTQFFESKIDPENYVIPKKFIDFWNKHVHLFEKKLINEDGTVNNLLYQTDLRYDTHIHYEFMNYMPFWYNEHETGLFGININITDPDYGMIIFIDYEDCDTAPLRTLYKYKKFIKSFEYYNKYKLMSYYSLDIYDLFINLNDEWYENFVLTDTFDESIDK